MIGPLTYLDLALIAVAFISGLLAMYRGFARELLSILSWIAAAAVGYWIFATKKDMTAEIAAQTSLPPQIATVAVAVPDVLVVQSSSAFKNLQDVVAYAKAHPNALSFGSAGIGSSLHIAGELFNQMAGIQTTHVPYKGGSAEMAPSNEQIAFAALMRGVHW